MFRLSFLLMNAIRDSITSTISSLLAGSSSKPSSSTNRFSFSNPYARMAAQTPAQEEFQSMLGRASRGPALDRHPDDERDEDDEQDEESWFQQRRVEEQMRLPSGGGAPGGRLNLPPPSFDSGRTTGVKGVIADARSFEQARREGSRRATIGTGSKEGGRINGAARGGRYKDDAEEGSSGEEEDEEDFLERWREERRKEITREGNDIRNRRTSPSMSRYGRFDEVDALGYLDAIEKVGRDTVVVVFVYDIEVCPRHPPAHASAVFASSMLTSFPSAPSRRSSRPLLRRWSPYTRPSTLSRCTTTTSSSTMRACRRSWRTSTRETSLRTSHTSSTRFPRIPCLTRRR